MRKKATHCKKGHEFLPDNTYVNPTNGQRLCKICQAAAARRRRKDGNLPTPSFKERFWSMVKKTKTCWNWTGALNGAGYGMISDRSTTSGSTAKRAHRVSYEMTSGKIPENMFVCHTCDNRKCVNPDHLFLGSNFDNVQDMVKKERHWLHGKTHCKNGHEFTPENTYYYAPTNNRCCRKCTNARSAKYHKKKKAIAH